MEEFVSYVALALMPIGIGCLVGLVIIAYKNRVRRIVRPSSYLPRKDDLLNKLLDAERNQKDKETSDYRLGYEIGYRESFHWITRIVKKFD